MHTYGRLRGAPLDLDKLEPLTRRDGRASRTSFSATDYLGALDYLRRMARQIVATWSDIDVLLTPTVAQPPLPIGGAGAEGGRAADPVAAERGRVGAVHARLERDRAAGDLAAAAPDAPRACPIGVQLVGPPAGEELLLSLSAQLEAARPWHERRPEPAVA